MLSKSKHVCLYHDKICVYYEPPLAGREIQYRAPDSRSRFINRNARPNNNELITYYLHVCYLLRIQQYPVNTSNKICHHFEGWSKENKYYITLPKKRNKTRYGFWRTWITLHIIKKFISFSSWRFLTLVHW